MKRFFWLLAALPVALAILLVGSRLYTADPPLAAAYQPQPPIRAAFFYPWFPKAWKQGGRELFTNYTPSLGVYDSQDDAVIDQQLRLAARAHLNAFITSWWGQGHHTDTAFQHILARSERSDSPNPALRWAVYYEEEGSSDPPVDEIVFDLQYLAKHFFSRPGYLRVDGRPVVFVYADASDGAAMADRWAKAKTQLGGNVYVVLKLYPGYKNDPNQPDSWHQYAPANAYDAHLPYAVTVSPGFWKAGEQPRLARDPARFESDLRRMIGSGAAWQLIVAWNEWGEGTSVEPAAQFGSAYVDALCRNLPGTADCGTPDATTQLNASAAGPTAGPNPTAVPTARPRAAATANVTAQRNPTARPNPTPAASPTPRPTIVPVNRTAVIAAAGDIACEGQSGGAACKQKATSDLLLTINPEAVLVLGDNQYEKGLYENFLAFFDPTWGRLKSRIRPAVGNHEYLTSGASGYFDYFNGIGSFSGVAGDRDKGYYSYDVGAWHIISANSNCREIGGYGAGSAQEQWLRADLAEHPTACSLLYMHHPYWTSDTRHFDTPALRPLVEAFYQAGGELILVGHSHFYERFAPSDPTGNLDREKGFRQFIVGTGGRNAYEFGTIKPNSEVRGANAFGVLKLILNPTSYEWEFLPIPGQTFTDSGKEQCR